MGRLGKPGGPPHIPIDTAHPKGSLTGLRPCVKGQAASAHRTIRHDGWHQRPFVHMSDLLRVVCVHDVTNCISAV